MRKLLGLVLLLMPMLVVAQPSKLDGTWKIDLDKGKMDSQPRVYELKNGTFSCVTLRSEGHNSRRREGS